MTYYRNRLLHVVVVTATFIAARNASADDAQQRLIEAGREQFMRVRNVQAISVDGLNVVQRTFNARSCAECHKLGGVGGAGTAANNVQFDGGTVVPRFGTAPDYAAERAAIVLPSAPARTTDVEIRPTGTSIVCVFCSPDRRPNLEELNTPALFGLGLIDKIPQAAIDEIAAGQGEAIRGRSPRLGGGRRGRFGWKSQTATLAEFNESACSSELGLTTARFLAAQQVSFRKRSPETWIVKVGPEAPKFDMSTSDLAALNQFVASLPQPVEHVSWNERNDAAEGKRLFAVIGCTRCHVPEVAGVAGIYSDLLLHKVGTASRSGYGGNSSGARESDVDVVGIDEIRTPPLWGVADSAPYLHDGSAPTLRAAVLRHAEQAGWAAEAFERRISEQQRIQVIAFLESLRAPTRLLAEPAAKTTVAARR